MKKGFTLIETLFYISMSVVLLGVIINSVVILSSSYRSLKKTKDIETSGLAVMNQIVKESHSASFVSASSSLSFGNVKFYLLDGKIKKDKDGHVSTLTADEVTVQSFILRPIQTPNSLGVKIELTIEGKNFYDTVLF